MKHLLVTNDFPPKVGGIQSYLYELWRRLPTGDVTVLTTSYDHATEWDAAQPFRIERTRESFLIPTPDLVRRVNKLAADVDAGIVVLDPAYPLGIAGPRLDFPYGVILHGAEVTIPAQIPFVQLLLRGVLRGASLTIAAGSYPAAQGCQAAGRAIRTVTVPPGVDVERFHRMGPGERDEARSVFAIDPDSLVVLCVSRLVPRKGVDVLLQAIARLGADEPRLQLVVAGDGRDRSRLQKLARMLNAPAVFLGAVPEDRLSMLYACADVFAMLCRNRWFGLEQEGFGIVFLEAAAAGVPAIAGASGGSAEAVVDGDTGYVVIDPANVDAVEAALARLIDQPDLRRRMGAAAHNRAVRDFSYDHLASRLDAAITDAVTTLRAVHG